MDNRAPPRLDEKDEHANPDQHSAPESVSYKIHVVAPNPNGGTISRRMTFEAPSPCRVGLLKEAVAEQLPGMSSDLTETVWWPCQVELVIVDGRRVSDNEELIDHTRDPIEVHLTEDSWQSVFNDFMKEVPERYQQRYKAFVYAVADLPFERTENLEGSYHMKRILDFLIGAHLPDLRTPSSEDLRFRFTDLLTSATEAAGATREGVLRVLDWKIRSDDFRSSYLKPEQHQGYDRIIKLFSALPVSDASSRGLPFIMLFFVELLEKAYRDAPQFRGKSGWEPPFVSSVVDVCDDLGPAATMLKVLEDLVLPN